VFKTTVSKAFWRALVLILTQLSAIFNVEWFPCPLAVPGMWCWEIEIPVGYFPKNLNEGVLHSCQEQQNFPRLMAVTGPIKRHGAPNKRSKFWLYPLLFLFSRVCPK
jgi:hypothetical protein